MECLEGHSLKKKTKERSVEHCRYYEKLKIFRMWIAGETVNAISLATGRCPATVYRWIKWWKHRGHVSKHLRTNQHCTVVQGGTANYPHKEFQPSPSSYLYGYYPQQCVTYCPREALSGVSCLPLNQRS